MGLNVLVPRYIIDVEGVYGKVQMEFISPNC